MSENAFDLTEYQLSFTVYPLGNEEQAQQLRERLQDLILKEIEAWGLYMSPVSIAKTQEAGNEQA